MLDFASVGAMSAADGDPAPPADLEVEQALLGAMLVNGAAYERVSGFLSADHFSNAIHGLVYGAIGELIGEGAKPDPMLVKDRLGEQPTLVPLGGSANFVARLMLAAGAPSNAAHYGRRITDLAQRRAMMLFAHDLKDAATNPDMPLAVIEPWALARMPCSAMPSLTMTCASDLAAQPPPARPWTVQDWIPRRQVTLLTGEGGGGKSQIAMQLQAAASTGMPWLGLAVDPCRSLGFYAEDEQDELHRRLCGIVELTGAAPSDLRDMYWRSVVSDDAEMIEADERSGDIRPTAYFRRIEREVMGSGARLLILDAVTNLFGADEIKRRQVNSFIGLLRRLAIKMDGAVVLLGHPSAAGIATGSGLSGSTHWHNAVRSRLYLARTTGDDADPDERTLTRLKANYAGSGDILRLRWQRGGFVSLEEPSGIDKAALGAKADRVFRALLAATYAEGIWTSPNPSSRNYAPTVFAKRPDRDGIGKQAFDGAFHRLKHCGAVKIESYGPPSNEHTRLVLT